MKTIKITQKHLDGLSPEIRNNPELMAMINTIITTFTKLEEMLGYDLVLVKDEGPIVIEANTPALISDDPDCELVVKVNGNDFKNDGHVTYINRILTSTPRDGKRPICVQYNDARYADGERTVWKEFSNNAQKVDKLPSDASINKIVVWFE